LLAAAVVGAGSCRPVSVVLGCWVFVIAVFVIIVRFSRRCVLLVVVLVVLIPCWVVVAVVVVVNK
jgi:hypothetical protein